MEKLVVSKVVKTQEVSGKWGPQVRSAFKTNEYGERIFSTFSKYAVKEGQTIEGTVEEQEKDGKTFHVFKFAPFNKPGTAGTGQPAGDLNRVERKVDALITEMQMIRGMLSQSQSKAIDDAFENY